MKFKSFFISASLIIICCKSNTLHDMKISQLEETSIIDLAPNIQKQGMKWLLKNMDKDDKNTLSTSFLIDNCNYAYEAWDNTPWGKVDESLFLEYVLPFSSLNERRDNWRQDFYERFFPIVKNAKSAYEAAAILNNNIFLFPVSNPLGKRHPFFSR